MSIFNSAFWKSRSWLEKALAALILAVLVLEKLGGRPPLLVALLEFLALAAGFALAVRYLRVWTAHLMWRLRHRLLITYIFIGVVPVLLLLTMAGLAGYLFYGQVATYLVGSRLVLIEEELALAVRATVRAAPAGGTGAGGEEAALAGVRSHLPASLAQLPLRVETTRDRPAWLKEEFHGLVRTPEGHLVRCALPRGAGLLVVSAPMTNELLSRVVSGIGTVRFLELNAEANALRPGGTGGRGQVQVGRHVYNLDRRSQGGLLPPQQGRFDIAISGLLTAPVVSWETGPQSAPAALVVTTRPSALNARLFSTLGESSGIPLTALAVVAIAFLMIEVVSLWIGTRLTRSITGAVADLYEGTERVHAGDFSWRIPVRSRDQLAALADSFNSMTASLEQLVREQKEKQRLQSELEIARVVQAQLFPREVPTLGGLELAGLCRPARTVSGDYYDFQVLDSRYLALVIGDIAGKGISAALLMASIQSMLHAQLSVARAGLSHDADFTAAALVAQLNRQLQKNIAPGHFATFCLVLYDDASGELTYTNAGHLPPLLLRAGQVRRLDKGGTVLGVFPAVRYEQETLRLEQGDILVAFTDGITEPENSYGEEFGEQRLLEVLRRTADRSPAEMAGAVMSAVSEWSGSPEQQDDMTLLIARRRAAS